MKTKSSETPPEGRSQPPVPPPVPLEEIARAVLSIRHGSVQIIIQDGRVVQIDKTEKMRLR